MAVDQPGGYADVFQRNVDASGVIPQISVILGPCAGGAVYSPAMTDFIFMVRRTSYMFVTGPGVVKTVTHETVTQEALGGANTHSTISGGAIHLSFELLLICTLILTTIQVSHRAFDTEMDALRAVRELVDYLPLSNTASIPVTCTSDTRHRCEDGLKYIIPEDPNTPYDMGHLVRKVVDNHSFFEIMPGIYNNNYY